MHLLFNIGKEFHIPLDLTLNEPPFWFLTLLELNLNDVAESNPYVSKIFTR